MKSNVCLKKSCSIILFFVIVLSVIPGCMKEQEKNNGITVISTIFPYYDFASQICGDKANISMLLPAGTESHTFDPSTRDIRNIKNCDLFIYTGGESDYWVEQILSALDSEVKTIKLMDIVKTYEEELSEGMQAEDEEDSEEEYDEHIWTSPKNAVTITRAIADAMKEISPENSDYFEENANAYIGELEKLDNDFESFFESHEIVMLFGDRFPLLYFAKEYDIEYYAAFPGCSAQTDVSAATMRKLTEIAKEKNISTVFYIELTSHNIADALAEAIGAKTALFHSCHNVTADDFKNGITYLDLMKNNLKILKEAYD